MISLTQKAVDAAKKIIEGHADKDKIKGLRVSVSGGGCSGFSYGLKLETRGDDANANDLEFDSGGIKIFTDTKSHFYLDGTEIDYYESIQQSGFVFKNPNASGSCGCGESFSV
jgi:iron-sulfur cluster assembly protein